jgi:hypothetical protein
MHLHDVVKLICLVQFVISSSKMLEVSNISIEESFATAVEESRLYGNRDDRQSCACRTTVTYKPPFGSQQGKIYFFALSRTFLQSTKLFIQWLPGFLHLA